MTEEDLVGGEGRQHRERGTNWEGLPVTGCWHEIGKNVRSPEVLEGSWQPAGRSSSPSLFRLSTGSGTPLQKDRPGSPNAHTLESSLVEVGEGVCDLVSLGHLPPPPPTQPTLSRAPSLDFQEKWEENH